VTKGNNGNLLSYTSAVDLGVINRISTTKTTQTTTPQPRPSNTHKPSPPEKQTTTSPEITRLAEQYPNAFSGKIGLLKDYQVHLHIDNQVKPVYQKFRPVPIHLQEAVEKEIKLMLDQDIIEPAVGPTPWVSPIVPVPKTGKPGHVRICTDSRASNKAILPCRHVCPTLDDVAVRVNGAAVISKLDLKAAFNQLAIDESSRSITTFATHMGLFRYKRLNFGINTASHELQKALEQLLAGLAGCFNMADDVLVFGRNRQEHDRNLHAVLKRLEEAGITLNVEKCEFAKEELDFFGLRITKAGIQIQPSKHAALLEAEAPTTPSEISSLLGLANYCSRFIPDLATVVEPMRRLTKASVPWVWSEAQEQALTALKQAVVADALAYFDKSLRTELTVDASPVGLGAVLAQYNPAQPDSKRIVLHISRALSPVEQRYSQVEREGLAVVWACERLHFYLYTKEFDLNTDNKAIELIFGNVMSKPKARIQRWALRLLPYRFVVKHIRGQDNIADYISRNPVAEEVSTGDHELVAERYVAMVTEAARPRAISRQELIEATASDPSLQQTRRMIEDEREPASGPYKHVRPELTVSSDGLILRGNLIVIPASLQKQVIKIAHGGHLGHVKTKQLLRQHVTFAGMDDMVKQAIQSCEKCQLNTRTDTSTPTETSEPPLKPWEFLSADFYGPLRSGKYLLVIIDQLSHFPICREISSTAAQVVIPTLINLFAEFGVPNKMKTDNGPPFNSKRFSDFAKNEGFHHQKVMPRWAQANGQVERFMRCLGKVMRNATVTGSMFEGELNEFLRNYRSTPHTTTGIPPASLLFQAAKPTRLPSSSTTTTTSETKELAATNEEKAKRAMKAYNDEKRKAKPSTIKVGDVVYLKAEQRRFKSDPIYERVPYTVVEVKGTMCTIDNSQHQLARHASLLKPKVCNDFWVDDLFTEPRQTEEEPLQTRIENEPVQVLNRETGIATAGQQQNRPAAPQVNTATEQNSTQTNNQHVNQNGSSTPRTSRTPKPAANQQHKRGHSGPTQSSTRPTRSSTRPRQAPERLGYGPQTAATTGRWTVPQGSDNNIQL
jgi:hypothetical protein